MLDFWSRSSLFNLLFFLQRFLSHKLFVSVCSHMFFLRIILVEGSCFLYCLIGDLEHTSVYTAVSGLRINVVAMCVQSKLRHMYMSKLSAMYSWVFCKFCLNYVAVKFLGTAKLVVNIKITAEAELNYYCDKGSQL